MSTLCELALWGALVLVIGRALSASAIVALLTAVVIIVSILKYEYTGTVALPVDVFAAVGVVYDLTTFPPISDGTSRRLPAWACSRVS